MNRILKDGRTLTIADLIRTRPPDAYTQAEQNEIKLMSFKEDDAHPYGSATYVIQRYPGDLDLYSQLVFDTKPTIAVKDLAAEMKQVVKRISSKPCHLVSDIKAGIDKAFDYSIGQLNDGIYIPNEPNLTKMVPFISSADQEQVLAYLNATRLTSYEYDEIEKIIRDYRIIRWTAADIKRGYVKKNGKCINLIQALQDKSFVKIDEITYVDGKFIEITNLLHIATIYQDQLYLINTAHNFLDDKEFIISYDTAIMKEIEKLFYSDVWFNPFKGAKRMFSFSRIHADKAGRYILALAPIISGGISALYQIKSEIDTIMLAQELTSSDCYKKHVNHRFDAWRVTISHTLELKVDEMNDLLSLLSATQLAYKQTHSIGVANDLVKSIKNIINNLTLTALQNSRLFPIPNFFLPDHRSYRRPLVGGC